jgi:hypothetical protein
MKRFLITLIIGACLIGVGLVVSLYEFKEWSNNAADIYEFGYKKASDTFQFELDGNELILSRKYYEDYEMEIIFVENKGNQLEVTVTYPEDLYTVRVTFDGTTLRVRGRIYNYTRLMLDMVENQQFVKDTTTVIHIIIYVDPNVDINYIP